MSQRMRVARRILVAAGIVVMGYALIGMVSTRSGPNPLWYIVFAGAGVLGHDAVLAPATIAVGGLVGRYVPASVRTLVTGGLVVSGVVTLLALPFVLGRGRTADVPSALPLDYGRGLLTVLAAIWLAVAVAAAVDAVRGRRVGEPRSGSRR